MTISKLRPLGFRPPTRHFGSGIPIPCPSAPSGNSPLLGSSAFQDVTSAAIDRTFARGPMVAARSGMAVDANHHDLGYKTSAGRALWKGSILGLWAAISRRLTEEG